MKNIEKIKSELAKRGINAEEVEIFKNGIRCMGFQIMTDLNVRPIVYYSQDETLSTFMEKIYVAMRQLPEFKIDVLKDRDFVLSNLFVSVQRKCVQEDVLSRNYLNVEVIMRLHINFGDVEEGSIKVSETLLDYAGISIEDAWKVAGENTKKKIFIKSMATILEMPEELFPEPLYVATTNNYVDGASALLYSDIFRKFCQNKGWSSCIILPSSTQEVLIVPDEDEFYYAGFAHIVNEVNNTVVDSMIQLDPVVYRYDIFADKIEIVAEV